MNGLYTKYMHIVEPPSPSPRVPIPTTTVSHSVRGQSTLLRVLIWLPIAGTKW